MKPVLPPATRMVFMSAVFLVSLSSLALEVFLARVFAISQWNHLAFMVISIALLGFAAAGTFLNIVELKKKGWMGRAASVESVVTLSLLHGAAVMAAFLTLNRLPLDYYRLPLEPIQVLFLLSAFVLLAIPFFFAGLVISLTYRLIPESTGLAYFASMTGSACGAALPALSLPAVSEGRLIIALAAVPLLIFLPVLGIGGTRAVKGFLPAVVIVGGAVLWLETVASPMLEIRTSPYKALAQTLQLPESRITALGNGIRGRMTVVASPYIRYAPGLSLKYDGDLPAQTAVFLDGDNQLTLYANPAQRPFRFAVYTLPSVAYRLFTPPGAVLILQSGGGLGIACALAAGSQSVTLLDTHPQRARISADHYDLTPSDLSPRQFLSRTDATYDVIQVESWGNALPGSAALSQEYLLTVDALKTYLEHLTPEGVVVMSRRLLLPPSDMLRLWATTFEALKRAGVSEPETHIAVLRSWDIYVMLASRRTFDKRGDLGQMAAELNFDWVYGSDIPAEWTNRFFVFDAPYHSQTVRRLADAYGRGQQKEFFDTYPLDVEPQSDDRPFPERFLKWLQLPEIYRTTGSRVYTLLLSGEIVVVVILIEAALLAAVLLVVPTALLGRTREVPDPVQIVFFLAIGAGFMLMELYFIKQLALLFGDPVVSFAVVLSAMLVSSGLGGYCSQWLTMKHLPVGLGILTVVLTVAIPATGWLSRVLLAWPSAQQVGAVYLWLAIPGVLSGLPFPIAMRLALKTPGARAYAWTANGCTSVLAAIFAAQLALSLGIATIMIAAATAYGLAILCSLKMRFPNSRGSIQTSPG